MADPRYQGAHQAIRRALLPYAYGQPCARNCGEIMLPGQDLALDHDDDGIGYIGFSHAVCNSRAGGRRRALGRKDRRRIMTELSRLALGVEIAWDRSRTAIAAAGLDAEGVIGVELVAYLDGPDTADEVAAWGRESKVKAVVIDPNSPAATLIEPLRRRHLGRKLIEPKVRDVTVATGDFLDAVRGGRVKVADQPALRAAVRHARTREVTGGIAFDRRTEVDASPLVAASLATWRATRLPKNGPRKIISVADDNASDAA